MIATEPRDYCKQPPGYGRVQTAFGVVSIPIDYQAWVDALPILSPELSEQLLGVMDVE